MPPKVQLEETAAEHLVRRVPRANQQDTAAQVRDRLPGAAFDSAEVICVLDETDRFIGLAPLTGVLSAPGDRPIRELMLSESPSVPMDCDQERAAGVAVHFGLTVLPVTDLEGKLVGVIPPHALMGILRREHVEDLHRLAGIRRETIHARMAMEAPPARRLRDRLPWLLVGLAGSFLATWILSRFEHVLQRRIAVAFFMPGIVYLADAIGTQTEAIAVRGLSLTHSPIQRLLTGELWTGTLIGCALAALAFPAVFLAFRDPGLASAVALAIVAAGAVATSIGLLLPWWLSRNGRDPALGSGPVATIVQDVLSVLIYLTITQWLVR